MTMDIKVLASIRLTCGGVYSVNMIPNLMYILFCNQCNGVELKLSSPTQAYVTSANLTTLFRPFGFLAPIDIKMIWL